MVECYKPWLNIRKLMTPIEINDKDAKSIVAVAPVDQKPGWESFQRTDAHQ